LITGTTPTLCHTPVEIFQSGTRCGTGTLEPGEQCDDGNIDNGDGCDSNCQVEPCFTCSGAPSVCTPAPSGTPCDDNDVCTSTACDGSGVCAVTSTISCDDGRPCTADTCDPQAGCQHTADLRVCHSAQMSRLLVRATGTDKDKLLWKWSKGALTSAAEFADPHADTSYTLCLYAGTAVAMEAVIPPSATAWSASPAGFIYTERGGTAGGIQHILLKPGDAGKAKISLKAGGANLPVSMPRLATPIIAQLVNGDTQLCWGTTFTDADVLVNSPGRLKARSVP